MRNNDKKSAVSPAAASASASAPATPPPPAPAEAVAVLSYPRRLSRRLLAGGPLLLVGHDRPDGDCLGAAFALARAAGAAGVEAAVVCDELPSRYAFLNADGAVALVRPGDSYAAVARAATVVVLDTSSLVQLESVAQTLVSCWGKLVVIDHHLTGSDLAQVRWVDAGAAATCVLVLDLLDDLGWPLTLTIAEALMTGICTDTGWLRFSNADARAFTAAARCVAAGADPDRLHRLLNQSDRPQRVALLSRALSGLDLLALPAPTGRDVEPLLAVMQLGSEDFQQTGALPEETEDLINEPMRIGRVAASVLLVQRDEADRTIRASLRSRPGSGIDVAAIAATFGGGGHRRAAGCRLTLPLPQARQALVVAVEQAAKTAQPD